MLVKVIDNSVIQQIKHDFLLVFHGKYDCISYNVEKILPLVYQ